MSLFHFNRKNVRKETALLGWETGQNTSVRRGRSTTTIARQRSHSGRNLGSGWNVSALEIRPERGKLIETIAAVPVVPVRAKCLIFNPLCWHLNGQLFCQKQPTKLAVIHFCCFFFFFFFHVDVYLYSQYLPHVSQLIQKAVA
jgi:hypothetical protein